MFFKILKQIFYIIEIFFAFTFDGAASIFSELFGAVPIMLVSVFISISILEKSNIALIFAIIAGILSDYQNGKLIGAQVFLFSILVILLKYLTVNFKNINFFIVILTTIIAVPAIISFKFLIFYVLRGYGGNSFAFWHYFLPNIIYTVIITPFVYYFNKIIAGRLLKR